MPYILILFVMNSGGDVSQIPLVYAPDKYSCESARKIVVRYNVPNPDFHIIDAKCISRVNTN